MGKMVTLLLILVFVELGMVMVGIVPIGIGSTLFKAIINLQAGNISDFFRELVGDVLTIGSSGVGLVGLLAAGAAVISGVFFPASDTKLFLPMALTLGIIGADITGIYGALASQSTLLATFIIAPIFVLYAMSVVEWLKNKD